MLIGRSFCLALLVLSLCAVAQARRTPPLNMPAPISPTSTGPLPNRPIQSEENLNVTQCLTMLLRFVSAGSIIAKSVQERTMPTESEQLLISKLARTPESCITLVRTHGVYLQNCVDGFKELFLSSMKKISEKTVDMTDYSATWEKAEQLKRDYCFTEEFKEKKPECYELVDKKSSELMLKFTELSRDVANQEEIRAKLAQLVNFGLLAQIFAVCL